MAYTNSKTDWQSGENFNFETELNRIEENVKTLAERNYTYSNNVTFSNGIKTDSLAGDPVIDGTRWDENDISGFALGFSPSAAAYNTQITTNTSDRVEMQSRSGSYIYYTGFNLTSSSPINNQIFLLTGRNGDHDVTITAVDTGDIVYSAHLGGDATYRNYFDTSVYGRQFKIVWTYLGSLPPFVFGGEITIRIRRATYPIIQGQPLKVWNSDFSATEHRAITQDDIDNNKLTS